MDLDWMLEITPQSQCKFDTSYVLLEQHSKVVKREVYSKKKAENFQYNQSLGGQNVCTLFGIAFDVGLFLFFILAKKLLQEKSFL